MLPAPLLSCIPRRCPNLSPFPCSCTQGTQSSHSSVNHPLEKGICSLTGKTYLGFWESSPEDEIEASSSLSCTRPSSSSSTSLVGLFKGEDSSWPGSGGGLPPLSFLKKGEKVNQIHSFPHQRNLEPKHAAGLALLISKPVT